VSQLFKGLSEKFKKRWLLIFRLIDWCSDCFSCIYCNYIYRERVPLKILFIQLLHIFLNAKKMPNFTKLQVTNVTIRQYYISPSRHFDIWYFANVTFHWSENLPTLNLPRASIKRITNKAIVHLLPDLCKLTWHIPNAFLALPR
jgi:hypothetical protein